MESVLTHFQPDVKEVCPDAPIILVGTKSDLRDDFMQNKKDLASKNISPISSEKSENLKKKINAHSYIECSALKQINVKEVFESAANAVLHKDEQEQTCCEID